MQPLLCPPAWWGEPSGRAVPAFPCARPVGADLRAARHGPSRRTARPEVGPYRREPPSRNPAAAGGGPAVRHGGHLPRRARIPQPAPLFSSLPQTHLRLWKIRTSSLVFRHPPAHEKSPSFRPCFRGVLPPMAGSKSVWLQPVVSTAISTADAQKRVPLERAPVALPRDLVVGQRL